MKKHITGKTQRKCANPTTGKKAQSNGLQLTEGKLTIGLDLGDRRSHYCILDEKGEVVSRGKVETSREGIGEQFGKMAASRIALEVGTHSPWVSRELSGMGHEVIVANPHRVRLISQSQRKNDRIDAEQLARLARVDPKLLAPIRHRGVGAQADLAVIRAREVAVKVRTTLITSARGLAKSMGERLKKCDASHAGKGLLEGASEELRAVVEPLLEAVEEINRQVANYERRMAEMAARYPEVELLTQIYGVGPITGLAYVLTVEDPWRFAHSRDVGPYLGLVPRQRESGEQQPEMRISKAGDRMLRSLLVEAAHCILRRGAPDSELRRWGVARMGSGGKVRRKRAVVAVARKLAVLLHHLWVSGEVYDPQYQSKVRERQQAAA